MNIRKFVFAGAAVLVVVAAKVFAEPKEVAAMSAATPVDVAENAKLVGEVRDLSRFVQITEKPVPMNPVVAAMCAIAINKPPDHSRLLPTPGAVFQVYITPESVVAMTAEKPLFPIGTVILKQKFSNAEAKSPELYTGMVKREKGFNPVCGDWEFFLMDGQAKGIVVRGQIASCMDCHKNYPQSDFVTRDYPIKPVAKSEK